MANNLPVFLLAFANDRQGRFLRSIATENQTISQILQKLDGDKYCELIVLADAKIEDIIRIFKEKRNRVHLFHYGGHANGYGMLMSSGAGEDEVADAASFARFLSQQENIKLAFLNGCSTHEQAQGLLDAGIGQVIVTSQDINDQAAQQFAQQFYESLANGVNIEAAYNDASNGIQISTGQNTRNLYWEEHKEEPEGLPWILLSGTHADHKWNPKRRGSDVVGEEVRRLISRGKTDKAIKALKEYLKAIDEDKYDELVLLARKKKDAEKKYRIGLIKDEDLSMTQQQVAYGILEIAKSLSEEE